MKTENKVNRQLMIYSAVALAIVIIFGGVYYLTGGKFDFANLAGATVEVDCSVAKPSTTIKITNTVDDGKYLTFTVKSNNDCALAEVKTLETLSQKGAVVLTLDGTQKTTKKSVTNVFAFKKEDYKLAGGQVKYKFTAVAKNGKTASITTGQHNL